MRPSQHDGNPFILGSLDIMTTTIQLDYLQDHLGSSLSTPLGTQDIAHSMPLSAAAAIESGAVPVPEPEQERGLGRSTVVWGSALVALTVALGLFAWLR
jgi:hypothetical protein